MQAVYIGIDDTDNLDTRGTGFRARQLAERLAEAKLAQTIGVTRHQLLVDDRVPYTSHNSSACIAVKPVCDMATLQEFCRSFLLEIAAEGSDVGLCLADEQQAGNAIAFGKTAKTALVGQQDARDLAGQHDIVLEGLTGDHQGIIGALSAVGLYADGNDGRYLWSRGLREHAEETLSLGALKEISNVDRVSLLQGETVIDDGVIIDLGPWPRAVRIDKKSVLLVEKVNGTSYKVLDKDVIKSVRP
jgi:hypothetical protein